jgi:DNA polymerase epsilon subunit 3
MADQYELPKAVVKRIIKEKLHTTNAAGQKKNVVLHKDVLLAVTESAKVFLNYLTSTANDICQGNKRQTISANDVLEALEDLAFTELVEPLKEALAGGCWQHEVQFLSCGRSPGWPRPGTAVCHLNKPLRRSEHYGIHCVCAPH